jgi:ribosomal protein S18 acetylase RimI-like enzyme
LIGRAEIRLRKASSLDAEFLAEMIDISNEGADRADFKTAIANVLIPASQVSHANAVIACCGTEACAALVMNAPPNQAVRLDEVPAEQIPFERLKAFAPQSLYIRNLACSKHYRRLGLGRVLVQLACNAAHLAGHAGTSAIVHRHNTAMRGLLASEGFECCASDFIESHCAFPSGVVIDLWLKPRH